VLFIEVQPVGRCEPRHPTRSPRVARHVILPPSHDSRLASDDMTSILVAPKLAY
jgi:hypothetical protein